MLTHKITLKNDYHNYE